MTLDEAQAYLDEMDDIELDSQQLKAVAGGGWCAIDCGCHGDTSSKRGGYPFRQ